MNTKSFEESSDRRVRRIMRKARRETGLRDVLTFAIGNAWSVTLVGASLFLAAVGAADRRKQRNMDGEQ